MWGSRVSRTLATPGCCCTRSSSGVLRNEAKESLALFQLLLSSFLPSTAPRPQEDFDAAAAEVVKYAIPNQTELLDVYALFKQATVGDVNEGACSLGP